MIEIRSGNRGTFQGKEAPVDGEQRVARRGRKVIDDAKRRWMGGREGGEKERGGRKGNCLGRRRLK